MHNFKELKAWKAGIEISKDTFQLCRSFPPEEKFGLIAQMVRAAVAIPSSIAEGCGRDSDKELYKFLSIALGSSFELETQFIIAKEFYYITQNILDNTCAQINGLREMIYALQENLNNQLVPSS